MKYLMLPGALISCLLLSCSSQENEITEELTPEQGSALFACTEYNPHYTAQKLDGGPTYELDLSKANGMTPIVYFGDTLGYQHYVNGVKHGPYLADNYDNINHHPDGNYVNGKKDGYFNRYNGDGSVHYVAYYEEDEFIWADWVFRMELWPSRPYVLNKDNVYIDAKYPNGNPWFKGEYRNGDPYGVHKYYLKNGRKYAEIDYEKSEIRYIPLEKGEELYVQEFEREDWDYQSK